MNYVDLLLLIPIGYGLVRGLFKGLVHEVLSLAAVILAIFLAYHFSDDLAKVLSDQMEQEATWIKIVSYLLIFISVTIALQIVSYIITRMLHMLALGFINRILGGFFGLAKVLLILLLLVFLLDPYLQGFRKEHEAWRNSVVYNQLKHYSHMPGQLLTNFRKEHLQESTGEPTRHV